MKDDEVRLITPEQAAELLQSEVAVSCTVAGRVEFISRLLSPPVVEEETEQ